MNWPSKVPQFEREKIANFLNSFDKYVRQNHEGNQQEDKYVIAQWDALKKLIYETPAQIYKHSQYVEKISEQPTFAYYRSQRAPKQGASNLDIPNTPGRLKRKNSSEQLNFELDKTRLQEYAHDTIMLIKKNNKEMLKL